MTLRQHAWPALTLVLLACSGARHRPAALAPLPFATDTVRTEALRDGVTRHYIYSRTGPWAINVLQVDLDRCYSAIAVKGADGAIGREKTSSLLRALAVRDDVVGGVNADFFSLTAPMGVPLGALVSRGRVLAGPSEQPVLAFDSSGAPRISVLRAAGSVDIGGQHFAIDAWNHASPSGVAMYDANWSTATDSATGVIEITVIGRNPMRVVAVDTMPAGVAIPRAGEVLIAGRSAPARVRTALAALGSGDTIRVSVALTPFHSREAVGGRPLLVRAGLIPNIVDTEGQPGFATGRHPRTAAGIARDGKRLILAVVDGRQMPYSDGMTLRELANLMIALGARDAINLDGGGSTTFVYAPRDSAHVLKIGNKPSDAAGERSVGDALAVVRGCKRR